MIFIIILLGLSFFLIGNVANAGTNEMLTYSDPRYGVEIQYPSNWQFSIDEGEPTFYPPGTDSTDKDIASIWFSKLNLNFSSGIGSSLEYWREYYDDLPNIEILKAVSNVTLDENSAYLLEWTTTDRKYTTRNIGTIVGTEEYYITFNATTKKYHEYLPIFQKMLDSFKIEFAEENIPYMTLSSAFWSADKLDVYVVVESKSSSLSSKYVQDAVSAINKWSEELKKHTNNSNAWIFDVHVVTESLNDNERFQSEDLFSPPADIILELRANTEDEICKELGGETLVPIDKSQSHVYSYVFTSCMSDELPHDEVYSTVLHEFGHGLGLGHTYYKNGDLMCSRDEDEYKRHIITCDYSQEQKEAPSDLNVQALIYKYGVDGFGTPNNELKGKEPRFYQDIYSVTKINNKTIVDRLLSKGWTALDFNRTQEAVKFFDEALAINPNDKDALFAKGYSLDNLGRYEDAIKYYDRILSIDSRDIFAIIQKGHVLVTLSKYEDAISSYDEALVIESNNVNALSGKGNALDSLGQYEDAIIWYDKALEIEPNNELILNDKGVTLYNLKRYQDAIIWYDKALEIDPDYVHALSNKANAFWSLGLYNDAITWFDKALEIVPDHVYALVGRADTLYALGQYQEAVIWYNKTLEIDPDHVYALTGKGNALDSLGQYEDAIIWYDKALEIEPNNELILNDKGFALTNLERYQEAITLYDRALEIDAHYFTALINKATAFRSLGQNEDAITWYDKALEIEPNNVDILKLKDSTISEFSK